jgi:hypothetical protein
MCFRANGLAAEILNKMGVKQGYPTALPPDSV